MAEEQPRVDAREAVGVQVGEGNTQIIYSYARSTWTDAPAPPPLVTVSGAVESPYRGLNSFDERDAAFFFFGRESAIAALLDRMAEATDPALLMVSGVSGAGKSSLLQAGILPQVRGEGLAGRPEAATWPSMLVTPTASPVAELAVAFAGAAHLDPGGLRRSLTAEPADLRLVARQAAAGDQASESLAGALGGRRVLLIVDQFEQLFTQCRNEAERRAFVAALHAAASRSGAGEPAILLVIGIRADYEARCADYPELAAAVDRRFLVRAMTERQLRMAITEPARMAGGEIDEQVDPGRARRADCQPSEWIRWHHRTVNRRGPSAALARLGPGLADAYSPDGDAGRLRTHWGDRGRDRPQRSTGLRVADR